MYKRLTDASKKVGIPRLEFASKSVNNSIFFNYCKIL